MNTYEVIITPQAETDLWEIRNYIADILLEPDTALDYINYISEKIEALEYVASSIAPVSDEPWHSREIRKFPAKEFFIYYRIDENKSCVHVISIIYNRRDQNKALQEKTENNRF